jgi:hypothetical protein
MKTGVLKYDGFVGVYIVPFSFGAILKKGLKAPGVQGSFVSFE